MATPLSAHRPQLLLTELRLASPPVVSCDSCGNPLTYRRSHLGGVNARWPEQWDYYECPAGCGTFQFRQRTGKLRRV